MILVWRMSGEERRCTGEVEVDTSEGIRIKMRCEMKVKMDERIDEK